ncbi:MAG: Cna B-type domain-containing protein [Lachnospiraceae bacterium]|nr:Cna B-type domain-containing protein [Lachnospiraceae bacterium]
MKRVRKKALAFFLAVSVVFTIGGMTAFAEEDTLFSEGSVMDESKCEDADLFLEEAGEDPDLSPDEVCEDPELPETGEDSSGELTAQAAPISVEAGEPDEDVIVLDNEEGIVLDNEDPKEEDDYGIQLLAGETYTIEVTDTKSITGTSANYSNSWSSSNTDVATVSGTGSTAVVTGRSPGTVTITHRYQTSYFATSLTETWTVIVSNTVSVCVYVSRADISYAMLDILGIDPHTIDSYGYFPVGIVYLDASYITADKWDAANTEKAPLINSEEDWQLLLRDLSNIDTSEAVFRDEYKANAGNNIGQYLSAAADYIGHEGGSGYTALFRNESEDEYTIENTKFHLDLLFHTNKVTYVYGDNGYSTGDAIDGREATDSLPYIRYTDVVPIEASSFLPEGFVFEGYYKDEHFLEPWDGTTSLKEDLIVYVKVSRVISIDVEKIWRDGGNEAGDRPEAVTVVLLADGEEVVGEYGSLTLCEACGWSGVFEDLYAEDEKGSEIAYTVEETEVPDGYSSEMSGDQESGYCITNTKLTSLVVTKAWNDASDHDGIRPDDLAITLTSNGDATEQRLTLRGDGDSWSGIFNDLPAYDENDDKIIYSATEEVPDGYTAVIRTLREGNVLITNTHNSLLVSDLTITKVWDDADDQDGIRPSSITVELQHDGQTVTDVYGTPWTAELTAEDIDEDGNWTIDVSDHPVYEMEGGLDIGYTLHEDDVAAGYETTDVDVTICSEEVEGATVYTGTVTLTNSHEPDPEGEPDPQDAGDKEDNKEDSGNVGDDDGGNDSNRSNGHGGNAGDGGHGGKGGKHGYNGDGGADTAEVTNLSDAPASKTSDTNAPYLYLFLIIPAGVAIVIVGVRRRAAGQ